MLRVALAALFVAASTVVSAQVRDSAGIRIVENPSPQRSGAQAWRIDARPFVDISGEGGNNEMSMVMTVVRLRDGRIAVASQGSSNVRFFDTTGKYLSSFGRKGNGPGEFPQLMRLYVLAGDTLVAATPVGLSLFTPEGRYVRNLPRADIHAFLPDGTGIGVDVSRTYRDRTTKTGTWIDTVPVVRIPPDRGRIDTIGRIGAMQRHSIVGSPQAEMVVFGPWFSVTSSSDRFYVGYQGAYEMQVYDRAGKLQRLQRRKPENRIIPDSFITAYKTSIANARTLSDGGEKIQISAEQAARMTANMRFARQYPEFVSLGVDRTGNLWVERYNDGKKVACGGFPCTITYHKAGTWDVFDPEGRWITTVTTPADFTPTDFGANYLGGVWRDSDDIEHVRYYRIVKP